MKDATARVAACAPPGAKVRVATPDGDYEVELPEGGTGQSILLDVLLQVLKREASSRTELAKALAQMEVANVRLSEAATQMEAMQRLAAGSIAQLAEIASRPMKPVYDATGKLIGIERVERLEGASR